LIDGTLMIVSVSFRFLSDEQLLAQCRVDHYRGSGPGGQKRNKTSNAVRLAHLPSGISATATESRSLKENHLHCLRRLRVKIAAEIREPIDPIRFEVPDWFLSVRHDRKIEVSHRHELYAATAGLILDLLAINGNPAAVAVNLGVTTTAIIKLLESETAWWAAANDIRSKQGLSVLQSRT
jgi:RF-1 domain